MPYMAIQTSVPVTGAVKENLKAELGRLISIIPGKQEADLLLDLTGERIMYYGGKAVPCAYVDLRVFTKADIDAQKKFTREVFALVHNKLGIPVENIYMTISEFDRWGYDGELH